MIGDLAGYALQDLIFYLSLVVLWAMGVQAGLTR